MRLREFMHSGDPQNDPTVLLTTLEFIRNRSHDGNAPMTISTQSIINTVKNTGAAFDYNALVAANENPAVKELIASINKDTVTLKGFGDDQADIDNDEINNTDLATDTVARMASSALSKRK